MSAQRTFVAQPPVAFMEPEIQDFIAMVRAGGEVGDAVLEENVRNAESLAVAHQGACLVAVAALKKPKASYRTNIHAKSKVAVDAGAFPFELGYVFVLPSARYGGIGLTLCNTALSPAGSKGVFATARTDNDGIRAILAKLGFSKAGKPYESTRGDYQLQLSLRPAAHQLVSGDVP